MRALKLAFRQLLRQPGYSIIATLTLALGIGACTAIFGVLDALLWKPLPYPAAERLVHLHETLSDGSFNGVAGGVFLDWREQAEGFEAVALINPVTRVFRGSAAPERLSGLEVSHEFLRVLGIPPLRGRGFLPGEDAAGGNNAVVMLTEEAWRSQFQGSESVVGSTIQLDEVPHTVVGILPRGVVPRGVWSPVGTSFVVPVVATRSEGGRFSRSYHWAMVYGRLREGVSQGTAEAQLKLLRRRMEPQYPAYKRAWSVALQGVHERVVGPARPMVLTLMAAVVVVLLIACANVANLMLARAWYRQQEMVVRAALGAGSRRLMGQVFTESLVLAAVGGGLGVMLAMVGIEVLGRVAGDLLPEGMNPRLDYRVVAFALALVGVAAGLSGVLPAWRARRPDLNATLKSGGRGATARGRQRTQAVLVVSEVALTVVLLGATGLLLRSLSNAVRVDPGFEPRHALAFEVALPEQKYNTDDVRFAFSQSVLERLRALPGVEAVGTGMGIPFQGGAFGERVGLSGVAGSDRDPLARINYVSPGFHEALGARLLAGRLLVEADDRPKAERVIVVNEAVVRRFFPEGVALDRRLLMLGNDWRVVGIVADMPDRQLDAPSPLCLYVPHVFNTSRFSFVVRAREQPLAAVESIRRVLREVDESVPMANVRVLESALEGSLNPRRVVLGLIASFGATAVLLAGLGLYGVLRYSVAMRQRELAIRLALGAEKRALLGTILGQSFWLGLLGLGVGLGGAVAMQRLLAGQLFGVQSLDPLVLAGTVLMVALVALTAGWLPACRAARTDPMIALRAD